MTIPARVFAALALILVPAPFMATAAVPDYPIDPDVQTTRQRLVVPEAPTPLEAIFPYEIQKYEANGYGHWHFEPGIDYGKQPTLMPPGYNPAAAVNVARLLNFFAISDLHVVDEESPVQAIYSGYQGGNSSAYSPVMLASTQVLDAAIQTANALHQQKPFDFGISLGDAANGSQYNELRWYIDVIDGQQIIPDSGVRDNPVAGPLNDYQDAYQAAGLDADIPFYQVLGNHDHFWLGSYPVTDYLRKFFTGTEILLMGDLFTDGPDSRIAYLGSLDGRTEFGTPYGAGLVADFTVDNVLTTPTVQAADPDRRPLSRSEWMNELLTSTSNPPGHGFTAQAVTSDTASYSFLPNPALPLKVIVLDDTQVDEGYMMFEQGYLNQERLDWLTDELDAGQAANQLMIIAAHVPCDIVGISPGTTSITSTTLLTRLSAYPNLIMWVAGHRHRNVVQSRTSIDPNHVGAQYGFWEVETASLRDFPQQFRMFEIMRNSDNSISIMTTDVDPSVTPNTPAGRSRDYAVAAKYLFNQGSPYNAGSVYNAELLKQLSPAMQQAIQNIGTPVATSCNSSVYWYD